MADKDVGIKEGDKFNAYLTFEHIGKLAVGCPCTAKKVSTHFIWAKDADGFQRAFDRTKFEFKHF